MQKLLTKLRADFPELRFTSGEVFSWSPKDQTVIYVLPTPLVPKSSPREEDGNPESTDPTWSLLHEVGHALLEHQTYVSDFELVKMEAAAWDKAAQLAGNYGVIIDPDHIQDCLDTYRDWLHRRSACPTCTTTSLQRNMTTYCCYNCNTEWRVSRSKLCRPYRRLHTKTARL